MVCPGAVSQMLEQQVVVVRSQGEPGEVQAAARQLPPEHSRPAQQPAVEVQLWPDAAQVAEGRQLPPVQASPAQHSGVEAQPVPCG